MKLRPDDASPDKNEIQKALLEALAERGLDTAKLKVSFGMSEDVLVMGVAGGFIHNLDYVDDSIFLDAANATLGIEEEEDGTPIPEEDLIHSKVPMTLSGYGLLNEEGELIGFACFGSQLKGHLPG